MKDNRYFKALDKRDRDVITTMLSMKDYVLEKMAEVDSTSNDGSEFVRSIMESLCLTVSVFTYGDEEAFEGILDDADPEGLYH